MRQAKQFTVTAYGLPRGNESGAEACNEAEQPALVDYGSLGGTGSTVESCYASVVVSLKQDVEFVFERTRVMCFASKKVHIQRSDASTTAVREAALQVLLARLTKELRDIVLE